MGARDLFIRRTAGGGAGGDTGWELSPLVRAAVEGGLVVLDGIDRCVCVCVCVCVRVCVRVRVRACVRAWKGTGWGRMCRIF